MSIESTTWPAKYPAERITVEFDFTRDLPPGDAVATVQLFFATVHGVDAAPANLLYATGPIKGARVFPQLQGGLGGCSYLVTCQATTQDGNIFVLARVLPVISL